MKLITPKASMAVAATSLFVALGGPSYAASLIDSSDVKNNSLTSSDIRNSTLTGSDVKNNSLTGTDIRNGSLRATDFGGSLPVGPTGPAGATGAAGAKGDKGDKGDPGVSRWALIGVDGQIEAQSGGFTVAAAYPTLAATAADPTGLRANGNVYVNAGDDLSNNGIAATIRLQNSQDQNSDAIVNGRAPGADSNPEFSGEISASVCGAAGTTTACAPPNTGNSNHFVVSPRNSDGSVTTDTTRKRFFVVISG